MKGIVWHWTAGTHTVSRLDMEHYHEIINGKGESYRGVFSPEDNLSTTDGKYAAHTRGYNTGMIGLAVAAMHGASERPFSWGKYPITQAQVNQLVERTAYYVKKYNIPVTRRTVLSHAEVEPTLGVKQLGKWDISVLPGMNNVKNPVEIGDYLRDKVKEKIAPTPFSWWRAFLRLFGGK